MLKQLLKGVPRAPIQAGDKVILTRHGLGVTYGTTEGKVYTIMPSDDGHCPYTIENKMGIAQWVYESDCIKVV
jgi:hypothetical protein